MSDVNHFLGKYRRLQKCSRSSEQRVAWSWRTAKNRSSYQWTIKLWSKWREPTTKQSNSGKNHWQVDLQLLTRHLPPMPGHAYLCLHFVRQSTALVADFETRFTWLAIWFWGSGTTGDAWSSWNNQCTDRLFSHCRYNVQTVIPNNIYRMFNRFLWR